MKLLLWLAATLVSAPALLVLFTIPEFHVSDTIEFRKQIEEIRTLHTTSDAIQKVALEEHWNARLATDLAHHTLILDVLSLLTLALAIVKSRKMSPEQR